MHNIQPISYVRFGGVEKHRVVCCFLSTVYLLSMLLGEIPLQLFNRLGIPQGHRAGS